MQEQVYFEDVRADVVNVPLTQETFQKVIKDLYGIEIPRMTEITLNSEDVETTPYHLLWGDAVANEYDTALAEWIEGIEGQYEILVRLYVP